MNTPVKRNIVCDLDGTLVKNDITLESLILFIKKDIFNFVWLLFWACRGRSYVKSKVAKIIDLEIRDFLFDPDILAYLETEYQKGNDIFIFSGSNQKYIDQISQEIGFIKDAQGSTKNSNLTGKHKLAALKSKFKDFHYIGNEKKDLEIWDHAQKVICSNSASSNLKNTIQKKYSNYCFIGEENIFGVYELLDLVRIHQWTKNILIFSPMFFTNQYSTDSFLILLLGFVAFSLLASSTYILNDIIDLSNDRAHPTKKDRIIAAGKISLLKASLISLVLFCASFALIFSFFNWYFIVAISAYTLTTITYSFYLKRIICLDLLTLSTLYTLRIISGAFAIGVPMSSWLAIFAILFFSSLASVKRLAEIKNMATDSSSIMGRGYTFDDQPIIKIFGMSVGLMSILFYAIYLSDIYDFSIGLNLSIITIPVLIHWLVRLYIKVERGLIFEDPVVFVIRDKTSYISLVLTFLFFYLGRFY